jgi:hypothetical protein
LIWKHYSLSKGDAFLTSENIAIEMLLSSLNSQKKDTILDMEFEEEFLDPISQSIMTDPVICEDGFTYDRSSIEKWFVEHDTSPMTNLR